MPTCGLRLACRTAPHAFPSDVPALSSTCAACGVVASDAQKLKPCGGCRRTLYCGKECQLDAWKRGHKGSCKVAPRALAAQHGATPLAHVASLVGMLRELEGSDVRVVASLLETLVDFSSMDFATIGLLDASAAGVVVRVCARHACHAPVQKMGLKLLSRLAQGEQLGAPTRPGSAEVFLAGGVELAAAALRASPADGRLQYDGLLLLAAVGGYAGVGTNEGLAARSGAAVCDKVELPLRALGDHVLGAWPRKLSAAPIEQAAVGFAAFAMLSPVANAKPDLLFDDARPTAIALLVTALQTFAAPSLERFERARAGTMTFGQLRDDTLKLGCRALANGIVGDGRRKAVVARAGGAQAAVATMRASTDLQVHTDACMLLRNLCSTSAHGAPKCHVDADGTPTLTSDAVRGMGPDVIEAKVHPPPHS